MIKKLFSSAAVACVALGGLTAVPASAQSYYSRDNYDQSRGQDDRYSDDQGQYSRDGRYENDRRQEEYRHYQQQQQRRVQYDRWYRSQQYRGYADRGNGSNYTYQNRYDHPGYRQQQRCSSGTTGAILGAVLGGLLGREVGRGGYYNQPSTTGLIIGAGGGALAGRAIERNGSCR